MVASTVSIGQSDVRVNPSHAPQVSVSCAGYNARARRMLAGMSPEQIQRENEHAARLRKSSRQLVEGPILDKFGNVWIPSPCWEPPAVAEWKKSGGQFRKLEGRLFDAWMFPRGTLGLEEAKSLYLRFFGTIVERERIYLRMAGGHTECEHV